MDQDHDSHFAWQVTIETPQHDKAALRSVMRERLRGAAQESRELLAELHTTLGELHAARRIAIFSPMAGEPDLTPLMTAMPLHDWLFPRVDGDRLHFHLVQDAAEQLKPGAFGIREPTSGLPMSAIADIDIFICPGLAFDTTGGRLGRGRGFYDRLLGEANEKALKIGVGFACQLVDTTYPEAHDIPMDAVLCKG